MLFGLRRPTIWNIMVIALVALLLETDALSRKTRLLEDDRDSQPSVDYMDINNGEESFVKPVDDKELEMLEREYSDNDGNDYRLQIDRVQQDDGWSDGNRSASPSEDRIAKRKRNLHADFNELKVNNEDLNVEVDADTRLLRSPGEMSPLQDGTIRDVDVPRLEIGWTGDPKTEFAEHMPVAFRDWPPIALEDRPLIALNDQHTIALDDQPPIEYSGRLPKAAQAPPQRLVERRHHARRRSSMQRGVRHLDNRNQLSSLVRIARPPNVESKAEDAFFMDRYGHVFKGIMRLPQSTQNHRDSINPSTSDEAKIQEKREDSTTKLDSTPATPNTGTANQTAQNGTKPQDDNATAPKKGSQFYQVMVTTDNKSQNRTVNGTASSGNNTSDEEAKKTMLKQIIAELEGFKAHPGEEGVSVDVENTPCSILGSWTSDAGGVRFDIAASSSAGQLNVSMAKTIPPKKDAWLNGSEWNVEGEIPFTDRGVFTLTVVHKTQHRAASFIGQCVKCGGEELVAGVWSTGRAARDCRDSIVAYGERPDVFRKEVLHILRAQRQREMAKHANDTSTPGPPTPTPEPSKKVKRWWEDSD